jgi:hypothetical protein
MLAGSATSMPSVLMSMMLAVSASQLLYCCANSTDGVPVGIALATKAACAIAPDRLATLIIAGRLYDERNERAYHYR